VFEMCDCILLGSTSTIIYFKETQIFFVMTFVCVLTRAEFHCRYLRVCPVEAPLADGLPVNVPS
jgi:hypothetical protein